MLGLTRSHRVCSGLIRPCMTMEKHRLHEIQVRTKVSTSKRHFGRAKRRAKFFVNSNRRKAIVLKNTILTPMKPNSAKRQCVQVVIPKWGYKMYAYVPVRKYPLQKWNRVMLETHWGFDVSMVKVKCKRGFFDLPSPEVGKNYPRSKVKLGPTKPSRKRIDVTLTKYITPQKEEASIYDYDV